MAMHKGEQAELMNRIEAARDMLPCEPDKARAALSAILESDTTRQEARLNAALAELGAPRLTVRYGEGKRGRPTWGVRFEAATMADALQAVERIASGQVEGVRHVPGAIGESYKGSVTPSEGYDSDYHGDLVQDAIPYHGRAEAAHYIKGSGVQVKCFAAVEGFGVIELAFELKDSDGIRVTARRKDYPGGFRYEDKRCTGWEKHFSKCVQTYSTPESLGQFTLIA